MNIQGNSSVSQLPVAKHETQPASDAGSELAPDSAPTPSTEGSPERAHNDGSSSSQDRGSSFLNWRSIREMASNTGGLSKSKSASTWSFSFLGGTSSLGLEKDDSQNTKKKEVKQKKSDTTTTTTEHPKELDKAALKQLFLSSDMAKLLEACDQVATAIAESMGRQRRKHQKTKQHQSSDEADSRSGSTLRSERSLGKHTVETHETAPATVEEHEPPQDLVLTLETKELIQLEVMLQTRILTLWKEKLQKSQDPKKQNSIRQEMAAVYRRLARLFSLYGDDECALGHLQEAMDVTEIESERYKTLRLKARLMAKNEYWDLAVEAMNEAIQMLEKQEREWEKNQQKRKEESGSSSKTNTNSKSHASSIISAKVELASLYEKMGNVGKAIAILERCVVVDLRPWLDFDNVNNSPNAYRLCATVHGKLGILLLETGSDDERAVVLLGKALEWSWEVYNLEHDEKMKKMAQLLLRALSQASDQQVHHSNFACHPKNPYYINKEEEQRQGSCWFPWFNDWSKTKNSSLV